jgi:hypothetical protein
VPRHSTLGAYFDAVAGYTNGHFVSKDTLFARFALPSLDRLTIANGFAVDAGDGHKVAVVKSVIDRFGNRTSQEILMDDIKNSVTKDNWHTLSRVAVENGAGVIDLFFRAVDAEKKSGYLLAKNMSAQEREARTLAFNHAPTVDYFFGSTMSDEDRADLLGTQTAAAAAALAEETPVPLALAEEAPVAVDIVSNPSPAPSVSAPVPPAATEPEPAPASEPAVIAVIIIPGEVSAETVQWSGTMLGRYYRDGAVWQTAVVLDNPVVQVEERGWGQVESIRRVQREHTQR